MPPVRWILNPESTPVVAAASGMAIGVACNQPALWPLAVLALPVLSACVVRSAARGVGASVVTVACGSLAWQATASWWLVLAVQPGPAQLAWQAMVLSLTAVSQVLLLLATWAPIAWAVQRRWRGTPPAIARALAWALAFACFETIRQWGWWGVGHASLGLALAELPGASGWWPWTGSQGLGAMAVALSSVAVAAGRWNSRQAAACAMSALALLLIGKGLSAQEATHAEGEALQVTAVQPGHDKKQAWTIAARDELLRQLSQAIDATPSGGLVVTPETFLPESPPRRAEGRWAELADHVARRQVHALVGMSFHWDEGAERGTLNAVVQVAPQRASLYAKQRLVPGAELLPWPGVFGGLYRSLLDGRSIGDRPAPAGLSQPLYAAGQAVGVTICHELAFPLAVAERSRGSGWLLNVSEDSWIASAGYRRQMASLARMRAAEFGRPLLRVSNGSASMLVGPRGEIQARAPDAGRRLWRLSVQPRTGSTFYESACETIAAAPVIAWAAAVLLLTWPSPRRRAASPTVGAAR